MQSDLHQKWSDVIVLFSFGAHLLDYTINISICRLFVYVNCSSDSRWWTMHVCKWGKGNFKPWENCPHVGNCLHFGVEKFVHSHSVTMAPYACWVFPSFRQTLIDACDEFLETNDRGTDKKRTEVIKRVCKDIIDIAQAKQETLPDDLEKVGKIILSLLTHR